MKTTTQTETTFAVTANESSAIMYLGTKQSAWPIFAWVGALGGLFAVMIQVVG